MLQKDCRSFLLTFFFLLAAVEASAIPPIDGRVPETNGTSTIPVQYERVIVINKDSVEASTVPSEDGAVPGAIENSTIPQINGRLINGQQTDISFYPFVVSMKATKNGVGIAGTGSLITNKCVLTAAHVVADVQNIEACGGSNEWLTGTCTGISLLTYMKGIDLAIVGLRTPLVGRNMRPIEVDFNRVPVDRWVQYFGFGGSPIRMLSGANFQVEPSNRCINDVEICYRDRNNWSFIQGGDSGGPLVYNGRQIGVTTAIAYVNGQFYNSIGVRVSHSVVQNFIRDSVSRYCY